MPDICQEKHKQIDKQFDINGTRLDNYGDRIDKIEQWKSGTDVAMNNLIEQIKSLVQSIRWLMTTTMLLLAGFFIWYIQSL